MNQTDKTNTDKQHNTHQRDLSPSVIRSSTQSNTGLQSREPKLRTHLGITIRGGRPAAFGARDLPTATPRPVDLVEWVRRAAVVVAGWLWC
jgi:hypothetical protein